MMRRMRVEIDINDLMSVCTELDDVIKQRTAKENKELVPILHRFGAYLDTLFGQVSLRTVLAHHPFEG